MHVRHVPRFYARSGRALLLTKWGRICGSRGLVWFEILLLSSGRSGKYILLLIISTDGCESEL